jgi:hypothetical protein
MSSTQDDSFLIFESSMAWIVAEAPHAR